MYGNQYGLCSKGDFKLETLLQQQNDARRRRYTSFGISFM